MAFESDVIAWCHSLDTLTMRSHSGQFLPFSDVTEHPRYGPLWVATVAKQHGFVATMSVQAYEVFSVCSFIPALSRDDLQDESSHSFPDGTQVEVLSAGGKEAVLVRHGDVGVLVTGRGKWKLLENVFVGCVRQVVVHVLVGVNRIHNYIGQCLDKEPVPFGKIEFCTVSITRNKKMSQLRSTKYKIHIIPSIMSPCCQVLLKHFAATGKPRREFYGHFEIQRRVDGRSRHNLIGGRNLQYVANFGARCVFHLKILTFAAWHCLLSVGLLIIEATRLAVHWCRFMTLQFSTDEPDLSRPGKEELTELYTGQEVIACFSDDGWYYPGMSTAAMTIHNTCLGRLPLKILILIPRSGCFSTFWIFLFLEISFW